jgi:hypothetical protein
MKTLANLIILGFTLWFFGQIYTGARHFVDRASQVIERATEVK